LGWCNHHQIVFEDANNKLEGLKTDAVNPLFLPGIAQIRNPRLIKSLQQDLLERGVRLIENCQLTAVNASQNQVHSVETSTGTFIFDQLIISAGAWTAGLLTDFFPTIRSDKPQILPVKGQMLLFAAEPHTLPQIILDGDSYLIPRLDGHILAGSTVEGNTFDKTVTSEAKDQISHFATSLLPALKGLPIVRHWAGIRPGTPSGIPYIDKHPEFRNLNINAGHFRNGLAMAPASARLMADLILNRNPCVAPEPYSLNRLS
ncbi:partial glycine oxidase, partial [biofilm metagenome]